MPTLELSDKELAVVKAAIEAFIRVHVGQPDIAMEPILYSGIRTDGRQLSVEETLMARELLSQAGAILTGIRNGGPGIFSERVNPKARIAFRLRARLVKDALSESMVDEDGNPTI